MKNFWLIILAAIFLLGDVNAAWRYFVIDDDLRGADGVKLGDVNNDGALDIVTGWEESGETRIYIYPGKNKVKEKWPFVTIGKTPSVEDAVFVDVNRDGWLDVVTCCEGEEKCMFVHDNPGHKYQKAINWRQQKIAASDQRMQWMFCQPIDIKGLGVPQLVAAGKNNHAEIGWFDMSEDGAISTWHALSQVGWVMSIIGADMDADGDFDIVFSDRKGKLRGCRWLENPGTTSKAAWQNHFIGAQDREVMFMTLTDFDQDGLVDVCVAAKPRSILFYHQTTENNWQEHELIYPSQTGTAKAVCIADMNLDGNLDLVMTCEHAEPPASGVFMITGKNIWSGEWSHVDISGPTGIKFDRIELYDLDDDGDPDILTCEERHADNGLGVVWYENPAK